jgi:phytoene synthase
MIEPAGRPVLTAMRRIYGGLLDEIERREFDVFKRRVELPRWKKLAIVAQSMWRGER